MKNESGFQDVIYYVEWKSGWRKENFSLRDQNLSRRAIKFAVMKGIFPSFRLINEDKLIINAFQREPAFGKS